MSKTWKQKNEERAEFWKAHLQQWSGTGLSQREYCRQNDLRPNRFTYWKIKFAKKNMPVELVQVPLPVRFTPKGLRLNIGKGLQIEIPDDFSTDTLERVLMTLKVVS